MEDVLLCVRSVLALTPRRWESLSQTIPEELLARKPAPKEWSARECLLHCVDTEGVSQARVKSFLVKMDFPAFDPETQGNKENAKLSADTLARKFRHMREESLALLGKIREEDLTLRVKHEELGAVTLGEMLHDWAGHDLMHLVQAERAMMQPFIQGCGPWKVYFTDHIVGGV
jgi:hypothetical protein